MKKIDNSTVERYQAPVRILQFGEGNFLRAFADWMVDIANEQGVLDATVAVVAPRFRENANIQALREQDGLYHVVLEGIADGKPARTTRLVKSISQVLSPTIDYAQYEAVTLSPDLKIVISNTTEAGIRYEPDDVTQPIPATFPGKVTAMLYKRYQRFAGSPDAGLIFLPCELIEDNGQRLRECVLRHAADAGLDADFAKWVGEACTFCDTLVDRIVPGFPADSIDAINQELGYADRMVVKGELYHLWVIGGEGYQKAQAALPLHTIGLNVEFLPEVKAFRDKKVRILNGSHTGMVPVALQLGCATVKEAFDHPLVNRFVSTMVEREVLPMIDGDRQQLKAFADSILERFYNPYIRHMLKSIALNSLSKWEARNFPTAADYRQRTGRSADYELFTLAALLALYAPDSEFEPDDNAEHVALIRRAWNDADLAQTVDAVVRGGIFQRDFEAEAPGLIETTSRWLSQIRTLGMEQALTNLLQES